MTALWRRLLGAALAGLIGWGAGLAQAQNSASPEHAVEAWQRRAPGAFPQVGPYQVLRGDLHIHTFHSDGRRTAKQRVFEAWRYGYDTIAITDHRNFRAYEEALPWAEALDLILIRGMETGVRGKEHIVALGFADDYVPRNPHSWAESEGQEQVYYREQMARMTQAGGLMLYAHPHVGLREPILWAIKEGHVIGVEVKNEVVSDRWNTVESHGTWCYPFAFDWALEHHLALFANSDIHQGRDESEPPVTLVLAETRTAEGVLAAIRARRTVAWFDGMLWGRQEHLEALARELVEVRATVTPEGEASWWRLRNRGPVVLEARVVGGGYDEREPTILGAYEEALLAGPPAAEKLTLEWCNLWINPRQTLRVEHAVLRP